MARQIRIIHVREFVKAKPDRQLDLDESKRLLLEVARFLDGRPCDPCEILIDTREAVSTLTSSDLLFLADCLVAQQKLAACRTAILCPAERFDYASFYATCVARHGVDLRAFMSFEEALEWLGAASPHPEPAARP
jgi:hypothetical protein